jgi:hypothetical protein
MLVWFGGELYNKTKLPLIIKRLPLTSSAKHGRFGEEDDSGRSI